MEPDKVFPAAGLGLPPKVPTPIRSPLGAGSHHHSLFRTTTPPNYRTSSAPPGGSPLMMMISPTRSFLSTSINIGSAGASSSSITGHKRRADHGVNIKNNPIGSDASTATNLGLLGANPGRYLSLKPGSGGAPSPLSPSGPLITPSPVAVVDPKDEERKKLKRIVSNRASAQKSRTKKFQYVADLEKMARTLEAEVARMSPKVQLYKNRMSALLIEQNNLNNQLADCARKQFLKQAETGRRRAEVHQLRLVQLQQQQNALAHSRRRAAAARASPGLNLELSLGRPSRSSAPHY